MYSAWRHKSGGDSQYSILFLIQYFNKELFKFF